IFRFHLRLFEQVLRFRKEYTYPQREQRQQPDQSEEHIDAEHIRRIQRLLNIRVHCVLSKEISDTVEKHDNHIMFLTVFRIQIFIIYVVKQVDQKCDEK